VGAPFVPNAASWKIAQQSGYCIKDYSFGPQTHQPILDGQSCQFVPVKSILFVEIRVLSGQLEASTSGSGPFPMWMIF